MTKWRYPIWLLRDVVAFASVLLSYLPLMIFLIVSGGRAARDRKFFEIY